MSLPHLLISSVAEYLAGPSDSAREAFEVFWLRSRHAAAQPAAVVSCLRLVSLGRLPPALLCGQQGQVLRFTRDYLEDDDKEYTIAVFKLFNQTGEPPLLPLTAAQDEALRAVFDVLTREYALPAPCFLILKALLKAFIMSLTRLQQQPFTPQDLQEKRVYQFLLLAEAHYVTQSGASFYAGQLGLSAKRLNQILLARLGQTATQFVHQRRLLEAKRELTIRERTVQEIAFRLGFEEPSYFARFFRKHAGVSPTAFQQQMFHIVSGIAPKGSE